MPSSSKAKARKQKQVKEASAKQASSTRASSKKAPVNNATAKKAVAKKAVAKKAVAKKAVAKKAPVPAGKKALAAGAKKAPRNEASSKTASSKAPAAGAKKISSKSAARGVKQTASRKTAGKSTPQPAKPARAALVVKAEPTLSRVARQALSQKRAIAAALGPAVDGKQIVDAYMRDVDHPFKQEMQAVREIILGASPKISERIKWNAPSFYYKEDLGAFNPRATEYAHLILLFPDGQGMQDASGLLEGNHKDRREAKFYGMDDVNKKKPALEKLVKSWVARRG